MSDLISRQAAIDALKRDEQYDEDIPNRADGVRDAIITISNLPTATERKRGEWIQDRLVSTNGGTYGVRRCSNCENYYQDVGYDRWNYCPNCGADMRREVER